MKKNSGKRMNGKTKSIIALCIVAAFMPFIIDGFTAIAGTGVDLGTVAK